MARPSKINERPAAGWQSRLAAGELLFHTLDGRGGSRDGDGSEPGPSGGWRGPIAGLRGRSPGLPCAALGRIDWALGGMLRPAA